MKQEPTAWMGKDLNDVYFAEKRGDLPCRLYQLAIPLYLAPRELSDEEIEQIASQYLSAHAQFIGAGEVCYEGEIEFARAILKKASEK